MISDDAVDVSRTLRLLGHATGRSCRMRCRSALAFMLEYTGLDRDGSYGLFDPKYCRIDGNLTLFFDRGLFSFAEFFEFTTDREK